MLPAPLGRPPTSSSGGLSRSSEDNYISDVGSTSHQRLIPASPDQYNNEAYETPTPRYPVGNNASFESQISRTAGTTGAVLRNPTMSNQYPGETPNPFRNSEPYTAGYEDQQFSAEPEEYLSTPTTATPLTQRQLQSRGVSLLDRGPVPGPEGVRRVSRPISKTGRPPSQTLPNQNRYSRGSTYNLPPGAAPPQPGGHSGYS